MTQQYLNQLTPSVKVFADKKSSPIDGIDVLEVTPETMAHIARHTGEDGTVFADTRVKQPARYRVQIAFPATPDPLSDVQKNLLDASYSPASKYTVTSYFSRCWNMMVVSSRHRDTPEMQGLRVQEVMFEECLEYEKTGLKLSDVKDDEDSANETQSSQLVTE